MSDKNVLLSDKARSKLYKGMKLASSAIGCTLGPKGKLVLIKRPDGSFLITKDGVTVSKAIKLQDRIEDLGAQLVAQAASKTNDLSGDGTTTSSVITHALVKRGMEHLAAGHSPLRLRRGIDAATALIIDEIDGMSIEVSTDDVKHVATISANGDETIGEAISQALQIVGKDGVVSVEDGRSMTPVTLETCDGLLLDRGYVSSYFVNDNEHMLSIYENARVLLCDHKIENLEDIVPILEKVLAARAPLLIIADDFGGTALQGLVLNRTKSNLSLCAIRAPGYGAQREQYLEDLRVLLGCNLVSHKVGVNIQKATLADLGTCRRFVCSAKQTTLIADNATSQVKEHVAALRERVADLTLDDQEVLQLQHRIARLGSGVVTLKVGGVTELDMIERKHRIEDALNAAKCALENGIVPGGGIALFHAQRDINVSALEEEERAGAEMVKLACQEPLRTIVTNTGTNADVVIDALLRNKDVPFYGFNARTNVYENMIEAGVIDPANVTKNAFRNAANIASLFLNLDAIVIDEHQT